MVKRLIPTGIAARAALAATLVSAILFVAGALWLRDVIYDERMAATEEVIREYLNGSLDPSWRLKNPPAGPGLTYEVVTSAGKILDSSGDLRAFETNGPVTPPPPWPVPGEGITLGYEELAPVTIGAAPAGVERIQPDLTGRTLRLVALTVQAEPIGEPGMVRLSVLVTPFAAEAAVAAVDRVLWPAVPIAVLLVAAVAWLATNRALRPVERIRAQAAEITARGLHQRVPVPNSRDAVARLATTLNVTLGRLEHSATQQRQFIADAAHELRSPIASLRTQLEVALDQSTRADWPAVATDAVIDVQRLQALADDLLLLARFDAEVAVPYGPVDLAELVREEVHEDRVVCHVDGPAPMLGHPAHLSRLVRNLVDNAVRHASSAVSVTVCMRPGEVVLEVADDGPGIPVEDRERVFERFTRLDEARTRDDGGAGLGLAIARDIAIRHGGRLVVGHSEAGARLIATFPSA